MNALLNLLGARGFFLNFVDCTFLDVAMPLLLPSAAILGASTTPVVVVGWSFPDISSSLELIMLSLKGILLRMIILSWWDVETDGEDPDDSIRPVCCCGCVLILLHADCSNHETET